MPNWVMNSQGGDGLLSPSVGSHILDAVEASPHCSTYMYVITFIHNSAKVPPVPQEPTFSRTDS